jgi:hypothetical protein
MRSDPMVAQLALHSRGFGLRLTTPHEANAAVLVAGAAGMAMWPAPLPFRPFNPVSPYCAALIAQWAALHDAAPGFWSPELRALDGPLLAPVLQYAQREYGHHFADRRFADLLASAPFSFEGNRFQARLHSCTCQPAYIWLNTMPTSFPLTLSDSQFTSSACLCLGLPARPANAFTLRCGCGTTVLSGYSDHPHLHLPRPAADVAPRLDYDKLAPYCYSDGRPHHGRALLPLLPHPFLAPRQPLYWTRACLLFGRLCFF